MVFSEEFLFIRVLLIIHYYIGETATRPDSPFQHHLHRPVYHWCRTLVFLSLCSTKPNKPHSLHHNIYKYHIHYKLGVTVGVPDRSFTYLAQ